MKQAKLIGLLLLLALLLPGVSNARNTDWAGPLVDSVVFTAGFEYNYDEDIYVTRQYALQRLAGFNNFYDIMAMPVGMAIQIETVRFVYNDVRYMVELWKGQYYASCGAEIGFYVGTTIDVMGAPHYRCANDDEMLDIEFSLMHKDDELFFVQGEHWWLTGFKPGYFAYPHELSLENIAITFDDEGMAEAFEAELYAMGFEEYNLFDAPDGVSRDMATVYFTWGEPKTEQPWAYEDMQTTLSFNKAQVTALNIFGWFFKLDKVYSPENITKAIEKSWWFGRRIYQKFKEYFNFFQTR